MGLFDMVMIKDNHISAAGGVTNALRSVDLYLESNNIQMGVEVSAIFVCMYMSSEFLYSQFEQLIDLDINMS